MRDRRVRDNAGDGQDLNLGGCTTLPGDVMWLIAGSGERER